MPSIHRLGRGAAAVSLASLLAVASSRVAADPPDAREVAKRWRDRGPARLEELARKFRDRFGRELPAALVARRKARVERRVAAGGFGLDGFHAGGLVVPELAPLNPLFDPLGIFEGEAGEEPPALPAARLFLADFDGDGDLDAFVGDKYGYVRYLRNDGGAGNDPVYVELTGGASPTGALDLSRDGDGDVPFGPSAPALVDVDGDDDLDLFVGQGYDDSPADDARVLFFENVGDATNGNLVRNDAGNPLAGFTFGEVGATPHFVDVDEDGDFDAFVGAKLHDLVPGDGEVYFLENQGDGDSPLFVDQTDSPADPFAGVTFSPVTAPFFADVDGDGDADAFVGTYYGVRFFENQTVVPGTPVFVERTGYDHPLAGSLFLAGGPVLADVDGDGDLDAFVTGGYSKLEIGWVRYLENTGTAGDSAFLSAGDRLELVDVDGDGDLDAIVSVVREPYEKGCECGGGLEVWLFENVGTPTTPVWELQSGAGNPFATWNALSPYAYTYTFPSLAATVGHLDGDGLLDAFVASYYGLEFLSDDGTGQLDPLPAHPIEAVDFGGDADPQLVDVDGDGELDLVVGHTRYDEGTETYYSYVSFFLNPTGPAGIDATPELVVDLTGAILRPAPTLVDVDGDGDLDLYVGGFYGDGVAPYYGYGLTLFIENTAGPGGLAFDPGSAAPVEALIAGPSSPALGDVDGDGILDLFLGDVKGVEMFLSAVPDLEVTKEITGGDLEPGGTIEYTVTIENVGDGDQPDDPASPELTDVLPPGLDLVSAMVTSGPGTVTVDLPNDTVRYDGAIAAGEVVTIVITAAIGEDAAGTYVVNQAVAFYDTDLDGANDAQEPSDDPSTAAEDDATVLALGAPVVLEVPTLSQWGAALFAALLSLAGVLGLRRRRG